MWLLLTRDNSTETGGNYCKTKATDTIDLESSGGSKGSSSLSMFFWSLGVFTLCVFPLYLQPCLSTSFVLRVTFSREKSSQLWAKLTDTTPLHFDWFHSVLLNSDGILRVFVVLWLDIVLPSKSCQTANVCDGIWKKNTTWTYDRDSISLHNGNTANTLAVPWQVFLSWDKFGMHPTQTHIQGVSSRGTRIHKILRWETIQLAFVILSTTNAKTSHILESSWDPFLFRS